LLHQHFQLVELGVTGCKIQDKGDQYQKPDWIKERFQSRTVDGRQQLLALVLPLQFGYASLFGDIFQLALGHLQLRLEAESVKFPVGNGGVMV
jgi:hypothetical protein